MDRTLIHWCLGLSLLFTILYLIFATYILYRFKLHIIPTQLAIIVLSLLNFIAKDVGFGILRHQDSIGNPDPEYNIKIIKGFSILTAFCFFVSFQILTIHLSI